MQNANWNGDNPNSQVVTMSMTGTVNMPGNPSDLAITMLCYVGVNGCTAMSTADSDGVEHTTAGLQVTSDQATSVMPQTSSTEVNATPNPQTISETSQTSDPPGKAGIVITIVFTSNLSHADPTVNCIITILDITHLYTNFPYHWHHRQPY